MSPADAPRVVALHLSPGKRAPQQAVERVLALANTGVEGDRHARAGGRRQRQVLLMEQEVLDALGLRPGDVREQVTVRGMSLDTLPAGTRLRVGEALLEVGQPCDPCERMDEIRPGLRTELEGRRGRFVLVVQGGSFAVGDTFVVEPPTGG